MKKVIKYILIAIMLVCTSIGISIALTSQLETPEVASTDIKGANNEVINPGETTGGTTGDAVEDHVGVFLVFRQEVPPVFHVRVDRTLDVALRIDVFGVAVV